MYRSELAGREAAGFPAEKGVNRSNALHTKWPPSARQPSAEANCISSSCLLSTSWMFSAPETSKPPSPITTCSPTPAVCLPTSAWSARSEVVVAPERKADPARRAAAPPKEVLAEAARTGRHVAEMQQRGRGAGRRAKGRVGRIAGRRALACRVLRISIAEDPAARCVHRGHLGGGPVDEELLAHALKRVGAVTRVVEGPAVLNLVKHVLGREHLAQDLAVDETGLVIDALDAPSLLRPPRQLLRLGHGQRGSGELDPVGCGHLYFFLRAQRLGHRRRGVGQALDCVPQPQRSHVAAIEDGFRAALAVLTQPATRHVTHLSHHTLRHSTAAAAAAIFSSIHLFLVPAAIATAAAATAAAQPDTAAIHLFLVPATAATAAAAEAAAAAAEAAAPVLGVPPALWPALEASRAEGAAKRRLRLRGRRIATHEAHLGRRQGVRLPFGCRRRCGQPGLRLLGTEALALAHTRPLAGAALDADHLAALLARRRPRRLGRGCSVAGIALLVEVCFRQHAAIELLLFLLRRRSNHATVELLLLLRLLLLHCGLLHCRSRKSAAIQLFLRVAHAASAALLALSRARPGVAGWNSELRAYPRMMCTLRANSCSAFAASLARSRASGHARATTSPPC
eukprot:scaffold25520_cov60-Phaeocystis_antarctica.AAC.2